MLRFNRLDWISDAFETWVIFLCLMKMPFQKLVMLKLLLCLSLAATWFWQGIHKRRKLKNTIRWQCHLLFALVVILDINQNFKERWFVYRAVTLVQVVQIVVECLKMGRDLEFHLCYRLFPRQSKSVRTSKSKWWRGWPTYTQAQESSPPRWNWIFCAHPLPHYKVEELKHATIKREVQQHL